MVGGACCIYRSALRGVSGGQDVLFGSHVYGQEAEAMRNAWIGEF